MRISLWKFFYMKLRSLDFAVETIRKPDNLLKSKETYTTLCFRKVALSILVKENGWSRYHATFEVIMNVVVLLVGWFRFSTSLYKKIWEQIQSKSRQKVYCKVEVHFWQLGQSWLLENETVLTSTGETRFIGVLQDYSQRGGNVVKHCVGGLLGPHALSLYMVVHISLVSLVFQISTQGYVFTIIMSKIHHKDMVLCYYACLVFGTFFQQLFLLEQGSCQP